MKRVNTGVIAAAGKGTRSYPRTTFIPKPLFRIDGKSILEKNIELLARKIKVKQIFVIVGHLAEQVTREFARDRAITITILRLGRLRREEDVLADEDPDLMWLARRAAAVAVERAVDRDQSQQLNWQSRWTVYHICARPPHPKFLLDGAGGRGFEPVYNFAAAWEGGSA